jgi:hypothetical protein
MILNCRSFALPLYLWASVCPGVQSLVNELVHGKETATSSSTEWIQGTIVMAARGITTKLSLNWATIIVLVEIEPRFPQGKHSLGRK